MVVVTRFAPSPTGFLHIGGARTALFNYLYARHTGGKCLLRIEDTDKARNVDGATLGIMLGLKWLGIEFDGQPVYQSSRADRHREVAFELAERGEAYWDYTSRAEMDALKAAWAVENPKAPFRYLNNPYRSGGHSPFVPDEPPVLRLVSPRDGETVIDDLVQGRVTVQNSELDDMILLRSDKTPTYMLAVVVDDYDAGVNTIIRGDDHLNNAFRQLTIYRAMGWVEPRYAHIPLMHDEHGKKFSKRNNAPGLKDFKQEGILPEAMFNYLLRMGWGHGDDEIISPEQAIEWFDIADVGRNPARFDPKKLLSLNAHYLRETADHSLAGMLSLNLKANGPQSVILRQAVPSLKPRCQTLVEMIEMARFYVERPILAEPLGDRIVDFDFAPVVAALPEDFTRDEIEAAIRQLAEQQGVKVKDLVAPLRLAITGSKVSPPLFEAMELLGREEVLARL